MREISEGRMRADARSGGPLSVPSEGRIRAAGQVLQPFVPPFAFGLCEEVYPFRVVAGVVDLYLCPVKVR